MEIYDFIVKDYQDNDVELKKYQGKVLLIMNTASQCGFRWHYGEFQELYDKYKEDGFEILDFPSHQFQQAPENEERIKKMREAEHKVTYPMFKKIWVNGPDEDPLYTFLKVKQKGFMGSAIKWNFTKFLVDRKGQVIKRYAPNATPDKMEADIKKALAAN